MPLIQISYRSDFGGRKDIALLYPAKAPNALPFLREESYVRPE